MSVDNTAFLKLLEYEQRSLAYEPQEGAGNLRSGEWIGVVFRIGEIRLTCNLTSDRLIWITQPRPRDFSQSRHDACRQAYEGLWYEGARF